VAFTHAPLTEAQLSAAARKLTNPGSPAPMRLMAARGLAPLPPRDLVVTLYQFWVTNEAPLAEESAKTILGLPTSVLAGALADAQLPAGVLDFLARKLTRNETILEGLIRHPNVDDETLAGLARLCPETICDQLADNQIRWLKCPAIVEGLYQNPNCRMSVVHKVLELAIREGIDVKLPNMEEIRIALGDGAAPADPSRDDVFRAAAGEQVAQRHARAVEQAEQLAVGETIDYDAMSVEGEDEFQLFVGDEPEDELSLPFDDALGDAPDAPEIPPEIGADANFEDEADDQPKGDRLTIITRLRPMEKIRLALMGSAFERSVLIRDSNKAVSLSAIKSPRVRENEVIAYAANRTLNPDVIRFIARRREWTKLYQVKLNLVLNPKTPMAAALGFLGHLHAHDVQKVARSRNIPSALAQAAKRKTAQRR